MSRFFSYGYIMRAISSRSRPPPRAGLRPPGLSRLINLGSGGWRRQRWAEFFPGVHGESVADGTSIITVRQRYTLENKRDVSLVALWRQKLNPSFHYFSKTTNIFLLFPVCICSDKHAAACNRFSRLATTTEDSSISQRDHVTSSLDRYVEFPLQLNCLNPCCLPRMAGVRRKEQKLVQEATADDKGHYLMGI